MTSLSYPPRPVPYEEQSSEPPRKRGQGERHMAGPSDPFGGQYTPDPFAPKSPTGRLPKIDPLMPTKQAEALKRKWEEKQAIEKAQRRAYEHKHRLAQEEARQRSEALERERLERRAREKAELDYQKWEFKRKTREQELERERQQQLALQAERTRRREQNEARARAEEARLEAWRQEQLYAREQQHLEAQRAAQISAEAKRKSGSYIPPPDAWRGNSPSIPPYGMNPNHGYYQNEVSTLAARSYPEQGLIEYTEPITPVQPTPQISPQVSPREEELLRLVKLQVEAISQLKSSLDELSSRQQLLEKRHQGTERAQQAIQKSNQQIHTSESASEPQPVSQESESVSHPQVDSSPSLTPASRLSTVHAELSELNRPQGILTRLTKRLKTLVVGDEEDWSEIDFSPETSLETNDSSERARVESNEHAHPITFQQGSKAQETSSVAHVTDQPSAMTTDEKPLSHDSDTSLRSPQIVQFSQGAFEEIVGGVTVSKTSQMGKDGPLYPILLQQAQLIKQHSVTIQTLGQRVNQLEGSLRAQSSDLKAQLKKLAKQVDRAEAKAEGVQQQKARVKSHQRRISQLEVMIEGLEGKIAIFEERLNSDGQGPATDLRVSPEPGIGDYTSIQDAINDAPVGAYIGIMPGIYCEPLEITKPLKLIGLGKPNEILIQVPVYSAIVVNRMGGHFEEAISHTQELAARKKLQQHTAYVQEPSRGGLLKWFKQKLWNEPEVDDRGLFEVETGSDEVSIVGVSINSVTEDVGGTPTDYPTMSIRSGHLRLEKCEIRAENGVGVLVEGESSQVTLRACRVVNTRGSAVRLRTRAVATLSGTRIMKSKENGIDAQGFTSVRLMDCEISNHQRIGVHIGFKSQLIAYQCVISGNSFEGVWMNHQSTGSIRSCDLRGNARGPYDISSDCQVEFANNKP